MTKLEVQSRVLKYGKPLDLDLFTWDETTKTFSSDEDYLVLDFHGVNSCTFKTGYNCTFMTGSRCTFNTGGVCTFNTGGDCTFKTGYDCTFNTGDGCTFKTGSYCTFNVYVNAYIINNNSNNVVVVRLHTTKKIYDLDTLEKDMFLNLTLDNVVSKPIKDVEDVEMVDEYIMIKLSTKKEIDGMSVYKAQYIQDYFDNEDETTFIAKQGKLTAHGSDIKDAMKNLIFKQQYKLGVEKNAKRVVKSDLVTMEDYRLLTGSCEVGTKRFLDEHGIAYDTVMSIEDTLKLVSKAKAYRYEVFIENLEKVGYKR